MLVVRNAESVENQQKLVGPSPIAREDLLPSFVGVSLLGANSEELTRVIVLPP